MDFHLCLCVYVCVRMHACGCVLVCVWKQTAIWEFQRDHTSILKVPHELTGRWQVDQKGKDHAQRSLVKKVRLTNST